MYRRGLVITAIFLALFGLWTGLRTYSIRLGEWTGSSYPRSVECGTPLNVLLQDGYAPGVYGTYEEKRCDQEAGERVGSMAWLLGLAAAASIAGLIRGPAPGVPSIDGVLQPLPTPEEMEQSDFGEPVGDRRRTVILPFRKTE